MANEYTPDSWKIVKITSEKHGEVYKVLASWYGGFTSGDSWKLSSGIVTCNVSDGEHGNVITMPQSSGSVYVLHENNEHVSGIMGSVFSSYAREAEDSNGLFTIEMVEFDKLPAVFP